MIDYVESSALAKLVLVEAEQSALKAYLAMSSATATSLLSVAEVARAAARRGEQERSTAALVFEGFLFLDIDRQVIDAAARLQPATLRTLDAIHVVSALQLGSELRSFVTYDVRLADAARAAGLPVVSPGT